MKLYPLNFHRTVSEAFSEEIPPNFHQPVSEVFSQVIPPTSLDTLLHKLLGKPNISTWRRESSIHNRHIAPGPRGEHLSLKYLKLSAIWNVGNYEIVWHASYQTGSPRTSTRPSHLSSWHLSRGNLSVTCSTISKIWMIHSICFKIVCLKF